MAQKTVKKRVRTRRKAADDQRQCLELRVLLFRDGDLWIAQCLEYDLAAQGSSGTDAKAAFVDVFIAQIAVALEKGETPLATIRPAPHRYHDMWARAVELRDTLRFAVPAEYLPANAPLPPSWMLRALAELRLTTT